MNTKLIALIGVSAATLFAQVEPTFWPATARGMNPTQLATTGYFYGYSDADGGGMSSFAWVNGVGEYDDPQLNADGSLPITLTLTPGATDLFAAMGANFLENDTDPSDMSANSGFCISYKATGAMDFEVKSGAGLALPEPARYNNYHMAIPAATSQTALDLPFASMVPSWGTAPLPMAEVKASITSVAFRIEKAPARSVTFTLYGFGLPGECGNVPVLDKVVMGSVNAMIAGRSLSFSGLGKTSVKFELIGLNGQVATSGIVTAAKNTVNLSKLSNGVYVLRANGKNINYSKMVTLK